MTWTLAWCFSLDYYTLLSVNATEPAAYVYCTSEAFETSVLLDAADFSPIGVRGSSSGPFDSSLAPAEAPLSLLVTN